ncbi:hypothetical protein, partial [Salipaludibacillus aurantiacus]|uniref:hypothetical protein n=1 Tax=Salipaludibacillus aurantiacus TaxID=1601833 RepID=UPI001C43606A
MPTTPYLKMKNGEPALGAVSPNPRKRGDRPITIARKYNKYINVNICNVFFRLILKKGGRG